MQNKWWSFNGGACACTGAVSSAGLGCVGILGLWSLKVFFGVLCLNWFFLYHKFWVCQPWLLCNCNENVRAVYLGPNIGGNIPCPTRHKDQGGKFNPSQVPAFCLARSLPYEPVKAYDIWFYAVAWIWCCDFKHQRMYGALDLIIREIVLWDSRWWMNEPLPFAKDYGCRWQNGRCVCRNGGTSSMHRCRNL